MLRKIRLIYYKWLLKRTYTRAVYLSEDFSCGIALAAFFRPEIAKLNKRAQELFKICKELENV